MRPVAASSWASVGDPCPTSWRPSASVRPNPGERVGRLRETLDVLTALWAGETVDYDGQYHHLRGARQEPRPLGHIPIVIGGIGKATLALVREFADWWNVDVSHLGTLDELRSQVGDARVSIQQTVSLVPRAALIATP